MLLWVGLSEPDVAPRIRAQGTHDDKVRAALRVYADEGRPQPEKPDRYTPPGAIAMSPVPRWGRFPALEDAEPKGESGRPENRIARAALFGLFERGLERARCPNKRRRRPTYDEIADEFGLKRTWITPIVKWAEAHQRQALRAVRTSKTPARFSTLVRD